MRILHVENRIILRLLGHLGKVEVERLGAFPVEHHEAYGIAPDLVHDVATRDEIAGPLRHLDRLAIPVELHELAEQDGELRLAAGDGAGERFATLDVTAGTGPQEQETHVKG